MRIGYGRVSTRDQHPEAQHDALEAAGCERIFIDHASGKLATRPELDKALLVAERAGDQLVVTKLDRLGRSLEHLIELSALLQARGVDLVVLDQGIDTSTAVGRLFFQIIGAPSASSSTRSCASARWTVWPPPEPAGGPAGRSRSSRPGRSSCFGVVRRRGEVPVPPKPRCAPTLDDRVVADALARRAGGATVKAIAPPRRPDVERREIETGTT
jgi:hypothetical protein